MQTYLDFLRFASSNLDLIVPIVSLAKQRETAEGFAARWSIDKQIGDLIAPRLDELSGATVSTSFDASAMESHLVTYVSDSQPGGDTVSATAFDGRKLRKIFEAIVPLILLIGAK
ncbi:MAG: hypothetical protein ACIALR_16545 [Blastopirellula sp. JB062]